MKDFNKWFREQRRLNAGETLSVNQAGNPSASTGGAQTVRLLGPFHVSHDTPGIGSSEDGALLVELVGPLVVLNIGIIVTEPFDGGPPPTSLGVYLGGPDFGAPDDDFALIGPSVNPGSSSSVGNGYALGISAQMLGLPAGGGEYAWTALFGRLDAEGALLTQLTGGTDMTEGAADIYALIAEPA